MTIVYRVGWVLYVLAGFSALSVLLSIGVFVAKRGSRRRYRDRLVYHRLLAVAAIDRDYTELVAALRRRPLEVLNEIALYGDQVIVPDELIGVIRESFAQTRGPRLLRRHLASRRVDRRLLASRLIRLYPSTELVDRLAARVRNERARFVSFTAWYSLLLLDDPRALDLLLDSAIERESTLFRRALRALEKAGPRVLEAARLRVPESDEAARLVLVHLAPLDGSGPLARLLVDSAASGGTALRDEACEIVRRHRPTRVRDPGTLGAQGEPCRKAALEAHFSLTRDLDGDLIDSLLCDSSIGADAERWVADLLRRVPEQLDYFVERYISLPPDGTLADAYARILASKVPFLLNYYLDRSPPTARLLLTGWVRTGHYAGIVDFLNRNRLSDIETTILGEIAALASEYPEFRTYCSRFLSDTLRDRLGLQAQAPTPGRGRIPTTRRDKLYLLALMVGALLFFPLIFLISRADALGGMHAGYLLRTFLVDYNYLFAGYAIALNGTYLILLYLSSREIRSQARLWQARDERVLLDGSVLPDMTILAPAYNEEKTVADSVRSLLALRYPNHQVVVVNDGSTDRTLDALIDSFALEQVDVAGRAEIQTAPVRGLYRNPHIPNLLVVDKENGGKADALNAAINYSAGEYICSIDSDSLLERDSLLAMAYPIAMGEREVVAVGGNVLPVNGCTVASGDLRAIHPPQNRIALLQTMEYLRSFIAARVGWASLNSLLIISGAFGVFSRKRVLEIGGYLTGTGIYRRDTVGEDMELVVRLVEHMCDRRARFAVEYAHNANCWTEVPEDMSSLLRQRDRWQRGLIEIMSYHKRMIFNPRYRGAGMVMFPYLLLFELVGPFWEVLGYITVALSLLFGLLSLQIVALLFAGSVLLGVSVSLGSLYLSEKGVLYFKGRDFFRVLSMTILENVGYRQLLGWHRSWAYFQFLVRNKGWQHLTRRGFLGRVAGAGTDAPDRGTL